MIDSAYEKTLKNWLGKVETMDSKVNKKTSREHKRTLHNSSGSMDDLNKNFSRQNKPFPKSQVSMNPHSKYPPHPKANNHTSCDVRDTLEKLYNKHSHNINSKLNTIMQKVNNFSSEVEKLKEQNKELHQRNVILMQLLQEKEGLKGKYFATEKNPNLNQTFSLSPTPKKSKSPKKIADEEEILLDDPTANEDEKATTIVNSMRDLVRKCASAIDSPVLFNLQENPGPSGVGDQTSTNEFFISEQTPMSEYDQLLSLAEEKIIYASAAFRCDKCLQNFIDCNQGDGVILKNCNHTYCQGCIKQHILEHTDLGSINCLQEDCEFSILESEIEALMTKEEYEVRDHHAIKNIKASMENPIQCVTKGCGNIVDVGKNVFDFKCPLCKNVNCLDCKKIHANGLTCRKLADLTFEEQVRNFATWESYHNDPLVFHTKDFECQICYGQYGPGEGVTLKECLHTFCKDCLTAYIENEDSASIKCPYADDKHSCSFNIQDREVKALLTKEAFEKYVSRSIKLAEGSMQNTVHCLTPDCEFFLTIEDMPNFTCEKCHELNCLECKAIHTNKTCRQHQEDLLEKSDPEKQADIAASEHALDNLVAQGLAMICPNCGAHAMKAEGCDAIVCRCKTELCWATKKTRWGPRGTGDTSGGCQCNVNGRRCHPNCQNCH
ncbi:unnamed protein product [Bemisia tabaci]|uniref:Uncharacterized protein n=1 Tax=Bemisia tabaci TaxID=7038 RepID=A0A9P0AJ41_BEMTA|nr:unnamed protein product [Bemisia tabaci]